MTKKLTDKNKPKEQKVISRFDQTNKPHDLFFKNSLKENPVLTRQFLEAHLDSKILKKINLDKVEFYPPTW